MNRRKKIRRHARTCEKLTAVVVTALKNLQLLLKPSLTPLRSQWKKKRDLTPPPERICMEMHSVELKSGLTKNTEPVADIQNVTPPEVIDTPNLEKRLMRIIQHQSLTQRHYTVYPRRDQCIARTHLLHKCLHP